MEIYQWLFRKNGFKVSPVGYFVYCNGNADAKAFDAKLEFDVKLLPYRGDDSWIEPVILKLKQCLVADTIPASEATCDYCAYCGARKEKEMEPEKKPAVRKTAPKKGASSELF
jgi:hypothetical protein